MIVVQDIRDYLVGYGIDVATLPDSFIQSRINSMIVKIEKETGKSFFEIRDATKITGAYGSSILQLSNFPVTEIVGVEILSDYFTPPPGMTTGEVPADSYVVNLEFGQISFISNQSWFPETENSVKVIYKYGFSVPPVDAVEGLINLIAASCLQNVSSRKGDQKSLSIEGWSVSYSGNSKFENIVNGFQITGMEFLSNYYEVVL